MDFLSIQVDSKLKVNDWTPFENKYSSCDNTIRNIIQKGDPLTMALSSLSTNGWTYVDNFKNSNKTHFLLKKESRYSRLSR
jgi:hypothetical protein